MSDPRPAPRDTSPSWLPWAPHAALFALCLIFVRSTLTRGDFVSDDAWISMRYSANFVHGDGLVWNPGHEPVEGYSNLLWVLLGALGLLVGAPLTTWLTGLGLAMGCAAVVLSWACAREVGARTGWALAAAALTALSSQIGATATLGLETPSLVLLMTAGTWRALVEERLIREGRAAAPWSALLFGLLTLAHVEGPFYLVVPALIRLSRFVAAPDAPRDLRRDAIALVLMLGPAVGQELLRIFYYHDWMPNTVRIKVMAKASNVSRVIGLRYVAWSLLCNTPLAALIGSGLVMGLLFRRDAGRAGQLAHLALLLPWLSCAGFAFLARGDMINQFRFMAPAVPTLLAAMVLGWQRVMDRAPGPLRLAALCVPLTLVVASGYRELSIQVVSHNRDHHRNPDDWMDELKRNMDQPMGRVSTFSRPLGRLWSPDPGMQQESVPWFVAWVLENVPVGQTVMFPDVGLLGLALGDGLVLDARGLNSRGPAALLASQPADGVEGMSDPGVVAFLEEFNALAPAALVLQACDGRVWGPPEAALQGAGLLDAYQSNAEGRYVQGNVRVFLRDVSGPTRAQVLARYERMLEVAPDVFDWHTRLLALQLGTAQPPEVHWMTDEQVTLYPAGTWSRDATGRGTSCR